MSRPAPTRALGNYPFRARHHRYPYVPSACYGPMDSLGIREEESHLLSVPALAFGLGKISARKSLSKSVR